MELPKKRNNQRTRVFDALYKVRKGERCFYCGEPKEEMDHCPPLKWIKDRKTHV